MKTIQIRNLFFLSLFFIVGTSQQIACNISKAEPIAAIKIETTPKTNKREKREAWKLKKKEKKIKTKKEQKQKKTDERLQKKLNRMNYFKLVSIVNYDLHLRGQKFTEIVSFITYLLAFSFSMWSVSNNFQPHKNSQGQNVLKKKEALKKSWFDICILLISLSNLVNIIIKSSIGLYNRTFSYQYPSYRNLLSSKTLLSLRSQLQRSKIDDLEKKQTPLESALHFRILLHRFIGEENTDSFKSWDGDVIKWFFSIFVLKKTKQNLLQIMERMEAFKEKENVNTIILQNERILRRIVRLYKYNISDGILYLMMPQMATIYLVATLVKIPETMASSAGYALHSCQPQSENYSTPNRHLSGLKMLWFIAIILPLLSITPVIFNKYSHDLVFKQMELL